jgi:hypothetical protein
VQQAILIYTYADFSLSALGTQPPGLRRLTLSGNQLAPDVMKLERDTEKPAMAPMTEADEEEEES